MVFRTQYDRERISCSSGDPIRIEYEMYYDENGMEQLREVGKVNMYDEIQSHAMSVDINYLLSRYVQGDLEALTRRQAVYGDFSQMPNTYAELLNRVNAAQNTFDALPLDIKHQFGDSMPQWLSSYGSPEWMVKMGIAQDLQKPVDVVKEVVSDDA